MECAKVADALIRIALGWAAKYFFARRLDHGKCFAKVGLQCKARLCECDTVLATLEQPQTVAFFDSPDPLADRGVAGVYKVAVELGGAVSLPVNVMVMGELTSIKTVAEIGVSRASFGPGPYLSAMSDLKDRFGALS